MGKPAARVGDMHACPMVNPGPVPHVGGPVLPPGCISVLIGGQPAARLGDMCACVGPPDTIIAGSSGVFIGSQPAARLGDSCAHGGAITIGNPTVLIGETGGAGLAALTVEDLSDLNKSVGVEKGKQIRQLITLKQAAANGEPFCEICH